MYSIIIYQVAPFPTLQLWANVNKFILTQPTLMLIEHEQCMRMGCDLVPQHEEFCLNEYDLLLSICLKILIYVDLPKRSA